MDGLTILTDPTKNITYSFCKDAIREKASNYEYIKNELRLFGLNLNDICEIEKDNIKKDLQKKSRLSDDIFHLIFEYDGRSLAEIEKIHRDTEAREFREYYEANHLILKCLINSPYRMTSYFNSDAIWRRMSVFTHQPSITHQVIRRTVRAIETPQLILYKTPKTVLPKNINIIKFRNNKMINNRRRNLKAIKY
uniref:Uncharacterized protein n=1 Tax=viral metagenome TaxID=1070528 RepID=A0A6C0E984_9ZZZZ